MKIVDFVSKPTLWKTPDVLLPLVGQRVHHRSLGENIDQVVANLKLFFGISHSIEPLLTNNSTLSDVTIPVESAVNLVSARLGERAVTIYIAALEESEVLVNTNLGGVSGYAWANAILLYFNPKKDWTRLLHKTTLHELNHCHRFPYGNPYESFLNWLIFEGLAQSFETEMVGEKIDPIKEAQIAEVYLPQLKTFWTAMPSDAGSWFFGDSSRQIPFALGYTVGHFLVRKYRQENNKLDWAQLIQQPAAAFIQTLS